MLCPISSSSLPIIIKPVFNNSIRQNSCSSLKNAAEGNAAKSYCCFTANYTADAGRQQDDSARCLRQRTLCQGGWRTGESARPKFIAALDFPGGAVNCHNLALVPKANGTLSSTLPASKQNRICGQDRFCFACRFLRMDLFQRLANCKAP